jgi:hypothetical protein
VSGDGRPRVVLQEDGRPAAQCEYCGAAAIEGHQYPGAPRTVWIPHDAGCPVRFRLLSGRWP